MKAVLSLAVALASFALLSGCGGGSSSNKTTTRSLVGTWKVTNLTHGIATTACPGTITEPAGGLGSSDSSSCGANDTFVFSSDGTLTMNENIGGEAVARPFAYAQSGNTLTLTDNASHPPFTETFTVSGTGSTLVLTLTALIGTAVATEQNSVGEVTTLAQQ